MNNTYPQWYMTPERATFLIFGSEQTGFWDAYKQGQFARATGVARDRNPFDIPPLHTHMTTFDWYRGWDKGVPVPIKVHASGGCTGVSDYEMSDGSIQTLRFAPSSSGDINGGSHAR